MFDTFCHAWCASARVRRRVSLVAARAGRPRRRRRRPRRSAAAPRARRRRSEPRPAGPRAGRLPGHQRPHAADGRPVVCVLGLVFGLVIFTQLQEPAGAPVDARDLRADLRDLQDVPDHAGQVHPDPRVFIGVIMVFYFGVLQHFAPIKVAIILLFSLIGIAGSYGVAWFGIRVNTFANSRAAFAGLRGQAVSDLRDSAQRRHEHRHAAHQRRAVHDAVHPALHPGRLRRLVLHRLRHRRVARRGGAAHRRRHLHQDRRHRRRPDEDRLQHQGRRRAQPGRHRRLHGRQRRRLGRPERRRLRDLRRHRRRADLVHPARGHRPDACRCSCSSGSS